MYRCTCNQILHSRQNTQIINPRFSNWKGNALSSLCTTQHNRYKYKYPMQVILLSHRLATIHLSILILPDILAQPVVLLTTQSCPLVHGTAPTCLFCQPMPPWCSRQSPWSSSAVPLSLVAQIQTDAPLLILPSKYILNKSTFLQLPRHHPNNIKYTNILWVESWLQFLMVK